jgi:Ca2+-binding EF-hand superfamily protein
MNLDKNKLTWVLTAVAAIICTKAAVAGPQRNREISDERRAKMLERFADEGIDADGDGQLSDNEIRAFRKEHRGDRGKGKGDRPNHARREGRRRGRGIAPLGRSGDVGSRGIGFALARLEVLNQQTAPVHFSLERFPEADADENGTLTDEEWLTFAGEARNRLVARLDNAIDTLDADEDGQVSDEELAALRTEHVNQVGDHIIERHPKSDTDGDGILSIEEWQVHVLAIDPGEFDGQRQRGPRGNRDFGQREFGRRGNGGDAKPKGPEL